MHDLWDTQALTGMYQVINMHTHAYHHTIFALVIMRSFSVDLANLLSRLRLDIWVFVGINVAGSAAEQCLQHET